MVIKGAYVAFCAFFWLTIVGPLYGNNTIAKRSSIPGYPPFLFHKGSEKSVIDEIIPPESDSEVLQGYSWNIASENYHQQGYTIDRTTAPRARSLSYMDNHTADFIVTTICMKGRSEKYFFPMKKFIRSRSPSMRPKIFRSTGKVWNRNKPYGGLPVESPQPKGACKNTV